jgi:hypothetical protein
MSKIVDKPLERGVWMRALFLEICLVVMALHLLVEHTFPFFPWMESMVGQVQAAVLQEFDHEDEFIITGTPSSGVSLFSTTTQLQIEVFSLAIPISPVTPPPK